MKSLTKIIGLLTVSVLGISSFSNAAIKPLDVNLLLNMKGKRVVMPEVNLNKNQKSFMVQPIGDTGEQAFVEVMPTKRGKRASQMNVRVGKLLADGSQLTLAKQSVVIIDGKDTAFTVTDEEGEKMTIQVRAR